MSLVDIWVTPLKAMVVVDTEGQTDEGEYLEMSKMLALPHANVVLALRGQSIFLNCVFSLLHGTRASTFDAIDLEMPRVLAQTTAYLKGMDRTFGQSIYEQEIALVGYSAIRGGMDCMVYQSEDEAGFTPQEVDGTYLSPWDASWGAPLKVVTPQDARIEATEQVVKALAMHPEAPFGGRLLLAELTREETRFSTLGHRLTNRTG